MRLYRVTVQRIREGSGFVAARSQDEAEEMIREDEATADWPLPQDYVEVTAEEWSRRAARVFAEQHPGEVVLTPDASDPTLADWLEGQKP